VSEFSSVSEPSLERVPPVWPLSRDLLQQIIDDRISDCFVAELIWERLGYQPSGEQGAAWLAGPTTPQAWKQVFPKAPPVIAQRPACVQLTRSIEKPYKQLLKEQLKFAGYRISELNPRRTRRATAVNWLLAWLAQRGEELLDHGPMPQLLEPPVDPLRGHPGDPIVE